MYKAVLKSSTLTNSNILAVLQNCTLFRDLELSQLQLVASHLQVATYKPDEVIYSQDNLGQNLHIIQSGLVKIGFHSQAGKYLLLNIYSSSQVYGEFSFLDGLPRATEVVAMTEVRSLVLTRPSFEELLVQLPQLYYAMFNLLTMKLRSITTTLEVSALEDAEGNLAYKLLQLAQPDANNNGVLTVKISQEMLASALGWSRIWLNRTLNKFVDRELIQLNWGKIMILQPERLKKMFG
jgi:CRP/FNR family transcriptional regulator